MALRLAAVMLALTVAKSAVAQETWSSLECRVIEESVSALIIRTETAVQRGRQIELTLRGTNYQTFAEMRDRLPEVPEVEDELERLRLLLRDKC